MKHELDRVKNDLETMQQAMGLAPAMDQEWVPWLKRDKWLNLWWCLPGLILVASSFLPDTREKHWGLVPAQWTGILIIAIMLAMLIVGWKTTNNESRPQGLVREYKRYFGLDRRGKWTNLMLILELFLFFLWAFHFRISAQAFMSGLFIIMGATYLVLSIIAQLWMLVAVAIPFLAFGLFETLLAGKGKIGAIPLGLMFIGIGLFSFIIQAWQVRQVEHQNESH